MAFCFILTLINSLLNNCVRRNKKAPPNGSALKWAHQGSNHIFYHTDYQLLNHSLQSWSPVWTPHFPRDENIPIMQAFAGICKLVIFLCLK